MILFNDKYLFPLFLEIVMLPGVSFKGVTIRGELFNFGICGLDIPMILLYKPLLLVNFIFVSYPSDGVVVVDEKNYKQKCKCDYKIFVQEDARHT